MADERNNGLAWDVLLCSMKQSTKFENSDIKNKTRQILVNQISKPLVVRSLEQHCARYGSKRWPSSLEWS
jgi:hypothetical protein